MRSSKPKSRGWAAWLGVIALSLNALVPIHLAFDLAEALGAAHLERAHRGGYDLERRLLALVSGHHDDASSRSDGHGTQHRAACPVCAALTALAGFAPAGATVLSLPCPVEAAAAPVALPGEPDDFPAASYRSRAPPLA